MTLRPYPDVVPNKISYRIIITAWADFYLELRKDKQTHLFCDGGGAIDRAFVLLREMTRMYVESGNDSMEVDATFFAKLISTLAPNQPSIIDPQVISDFQKAEAIYCYMEELNNKTGDHRFKLDCQILCAMIVVYAKTGRPHEAAALLDRLEYEATIQKDADILPRACYFRGRSRHVNYCAPVTRHDLTYSCSVVP